MLGESVYCASFKAFRNVSGWCDLCLRGHVIEILSLEMSFERWLFVRLLGLTLVTILFAGDGNASIVVVKRTPVMHTV